MSRRDGTVIVRCHGGTGRQLFDVTAGRDGNSQREVFYRRDGTVIFNGKDFIGETGRYVTTVREFVGGKGRRDHFDGGLTVPSRRCRRCRRYRAAEIP